MNLLPFLQTYTARSYDLTHLFDFLQLILPHAVTEVHGIIHTVKGEESVLEALLLPPKATARFSDGISHRKTKWETITAWHDGDVFLNHHTL